MCVVELPIIGSNAITGVHVDERKVVVGCMYTQVDPLRDLPVNPEILSRLSQLNSTQLFRCEEAPAQVLY